MKYHSAPIFPDDPPLEPDLEWMLQSGQFPADVLAVELVRAYFEDVFHWMLLVLDDPELAAYTSLDAILAAALNAYRFPGEISSQIWVFRQVARQARRAMQRSAWARVWSNIAWKPGRHPQRQSWPETYLDAALWLAIDRLPAPHRLAAGLAWGLGNEPGVIAQILNVPEAEINAMLAKAHRRSLDSLAAFGLKPADLPEQDLELALNGSLARRYAQFQSGQVDVELLAGEVSAELKRQVGRQSRWVRWKEFAWLGVLVTLILGAFWVINLLLPEPELEDPPSGTSQSAAQATSDYLLSNGIVRMNYFPQPGETVDEIGALLRLPPREIARLRGAYPDGSLDITRPVVVELSPPKDLAEPTPVAPVARSTAPLTVDSSPAEIRKLMNSSRSLWQSLWLDSVYFNYGLPGFTGLPRTTRVQAWLSKPASSLAVTWKSGEDNTLIILNKEEMVYFVSPAGIFQARHADTPGLYSTPLALEMVDPGHSEIFNQPGQMQILGEEEIAGRHTLVIDWRTDERGIWPDQYRIWVDTQIGIILRYQFFANPISDALLGEVIFAQIALDVNFPQPDLFSLYRLPERVFVSDYLGEQVDASVLPVLPSTPAGRDKLLQIPPGPAFDPANANLSFQFPENGPLKDQLMMADVFAGSAYLGKIVLSNPENMICVRSQDGRQLAYTYDPYGNPDIMGIGWFRLEFPIRLERVEIPLVPNSMAFSPDGRYLAYFASPLYASLGSLAVIDTQTGRQQQLAQLIYAASLVWSPDGKSLAMIVADPEPDQREVRVFDVATRAFVFRHKVSIDSVLDSDLRGTDWPAPDWPARDWGVNFPATEQHLSDCLDPGP